MNQYYYLLVYILLGISSCFLPIIVAREAIVGGTIALRYYFRYHATIMIPGRAPDCGGGIIRNDSIITAARCVVGIDGLLIAKHISVLVGITHLTTPGVVAEVERVFVPVTYTPRISNLIADVAVLKLKTQLDMENHDLTHLFLPKDQNKSYNNEHAKIAGFGWDKMFSNSIVGENSDHKLRYAVAVVRNQIQCQQDHPNLEILEQHLCARVKPDRPVDGDRYGVCAGDTGSPLVDGRNFFIGILSISTTECSERTSSGIYTRTTTYNKFIRNALSNKVTRNMRELYV